MWVNVWEFYLEPEKADKFWEHNRLLGQWHQFFRQSDAFIGTTLLCLDPIKHRYATADRWRSGKGYREYIEREQERYNQLSELNALLCKKRTRIGHKTVGKDDSLLSVLASLSQPAQEHIADIRALVSDKWFSSDQYQATY